MNSKNKMMSSNTLTNIKKDIKILYNKLFFPNNPSCPVCGKILFLSSDIICKDCHNKLAWHENPCKICGRELKAASHDICNDCATRKENNENYIKEGKSLFTFDNYAGRIIYSIKAAGRKGLGINAGKFIKENIDNDFFENIDIIVPVPMYFKKEKERGFNQASLIAEGLSESVKLNVKDDILIKLKTKEQKTLSEEERKLNMKNAIRINELSKKAIKNKNILLIDDVYTTGATANACAEILLREGSANSVKFLSIAATKEI